VGDWSLRVLMLCGALPLYASLRHRAASDFGNGARHMNNKVIAAFERLRIGGNCRVTEFLALVPMSRSKYYELVRSGELKPIRIGRNELLPPAEAVKFLPGLAA
jgi:hypothetical protein